MNTLQAQFKLQRSDFVLDTEFASPMRGVTALFGPSGSGKTTVLRCLAGLEQPEGRMQLGETTWQDDASGLFIPAYQRAIGYVFQEARLFPHLTVQRNLEFGRKRLPRDKQTPMEPVVEMLGLGELLKRSPQGLSGGEQQRVAIGRALLTAPELLLMDEPMSGLDFQRKNEILPYLETLHDELEIPIIYVSHDIDEVSRLADEMIYLENGSVTAKGPVWQLLARLDLPFTHGGDATSLIDAVVADHDDEFSLTHLDFQGGRIHIARVDRAIGKHARVSIHARDVSLALEHPRDTSILNIFPATIEQVIDEGPVQVTVRLNAGGSPLLSRITRKSATLLNLQPGTKVFAQIKSVALAN